jgi:hypothetical protein
MVVVALEFAVLILIGAVVLLLVRGPMVALGFLFLGGAAVSLRVGRPTNAVEFLILAGAAISLRVGRPINRVHHGPALAAHVVVRFAAALVLGIFTVQAARYGAARGDGLGWLLVPAALAVLTFASGAVLIWVALADSGSRLCRVGLHRWMDIWSDAGPHRACARCGDRATGKRRAIWSAAVLGAFTFALVTPVAALAAGVYVATRLPPNYGLARSTACWRAHGYKVSRPERDHRFRSIEIRGHHDQEDATFAPSQPAAWSWVDDNYDGGGDYYAPPPVPVRNVVFGYSGRFDDKPILACLRTSKD